MGTQIAPVAVSDTRNVQQNVSAVVRMLMALHGLNQTELAEAVHTGQPRISDKLAGRRRWHVEDVAILANYLGDFIAERCVVNENAWVLCSDLFDAYVKWAEGEGERPKRRRNRNGTPRNTDSDLFAQHTHGRKDPNLCSLEFRSARRRPAGQPQKARARSGVRASTSGPCHRDLVVGCCIRGGTFDGGAGRSVAVGCTG